MPPVKPTFPNPRVQDLQQDLSKLESTVRQARKPDGTVDLDKLQAKVNDSGDPDLLRGLNAVKDAFERTEMREVSAGCSGGTVTRAVSVDAEELDSSEVQSVFQALLAAKSKVAGLDTDGDGRVSKSEADGAVDGRGLASTLAEDIVAGSLAAYKVELSKWNHELDKVRISIEARGSFDRKMVGTAGDHAATQPGAEAITWAYRDLVTQGRDTDIWKVESDLDGAETSWLRHIPLFGRLVRGDGHLSDKEVRKYLGTDDLAQFVADKKATLEARLGGTYEATFLAGTDLPGSEQLEDPDFQRSSASC